MPPASPPTGGSGATLCPSGTATPRTLSRAGSLSPSARASATPSRSHRPSATGGGGAARRGGVVDTEPVAVVVRVRPPPSGGGCGGGGGGGGNAGVAPGSDGRTIVATLPPAAPPHGGGVATSTTATPIQNSYTFHAADVYDTARVARLVDATVAGYSATVFAYGQTGSGKTHTMLGPDRAADADAGLVERATHALFSQVAAASTADGCTYSVRAAAAEIYNEAVFDLLAPPTPPSASSPLARTPLAVKYDPGRGFHAPALTHVPARDAKDAARAFAAGAAARRVARHALNAESSRSHALFMLFVEVVPPPVGVATGGGGGGGTATPPTDAATTTPHPVRRLGRITFVDLAGSEKATASRSAGGTLREAGAINRSLFALRHVVAALAAPPPPPGAPPRHVPYRDSKLTKLLMDSLNGGLALLVACVSPARSAADESAATLVFAARAASLRTTPSLQVDPSDATLAALKREVLLLRAENAYLRGAAAGLPARGGSGATASGATTPGGTLRPRADADDDDGALGDEGPSSGAPSARATRDLSAAAARPASPLPSPPRALARALADWRALAAAMAAENAALAAAARRRGGGDGLPGGGGGGGRPAGQGGRAGGGVGDGQGRGERAQAGESVREEERVGCFFYALFFVVSLTHSHC